MALPADLSTLVKFNRTTTPASFQFQDDTDYTSLSISANDIRGVYKVTDPLGNIIHNNTSFGTPDILGSTSLYFSGLAMPTDINSDPIEGTYLVDYSVVVDNPITAINQGSKTFTIAGDVASLIPNGSTITIVRSSTGNNGSYTVVSAVYGVSTVVTVVEAIPNSGIGGASMQYANQAVYNETQVSATYSDDLPELQIESEVDCFCGTLKSIDSTNYGNATINSRVHKVYYPVALNFAPITSSNVEVLVSPIYTQTWTTTLEVNITYTLPDGSTIDAILTGSKETIVDCDLSLCQISCCVIALNNRYKNNRVDNPQQAALDLASLNRIFQLVELFQMAQSCGQTTEASIALTEIKTIGNCGDACSCDDSDLPQQVVPLCTSGSGTNVVVSAGTGISINTTVNGNTVTYEVSISSSVMSIINSLAPVNVVGGVGITVVKTTPGGVDTYTVTNTLPFNPLDTQQAKCLIEYSNFAAPTVALTTSNIVSEGPNMAPMTVASSGSVGVGLWKFEENLFVVSGFQTSPNSTYKPILSFTQLETQTLSGSITTQANQFSSAQPVDIRILDIGSGTFKFQFVEKVSGNPISNYAMVYNYKIMVNIEIKQ